MVVLNIVSELDDTALWFADLADICDIFIGDISSPLIGFGLCVNMGLDIKTGGIKSEIQPSPCKRWKKLFLQQVSENKI